MMCWSQPNLDAMELPWRIMIATIGLPRNTHWHDFDENDPLHCTLRLDECLELWIGLTLPYRSPGTRISIPD
jgi:hypothetical protein